jgi:SAM-dependent methyltransferase
MNLRMFLGRFLIRFGRFIQSLSIMVMRPDDLVEFSRQTYAKKKNVEGWGSDDLLDSGLDPDEEELIKKVPLHEGKLLLLGVGGGREAIPLSQMGFEVTGLDFVEDMVSSAKDNARKRGVNISGIVQEISKLDVPAGSYDIVWLSSAMYSCVPTKRRRINMLRRIAHTLKSGGYFICQFHWDQHVGFSRKVEFARKLFALLSMGNLWYEKGDMLWNNVEFIHAFYSEQELQSEFKAGGFEIIFIDCPKESIRGGALLKKR